MVSPVSVRERFNRIAQERILILDGAMGSFIQEFAASKNVFVPPPVKDSSRSPNGCNDFLCLTQPRLISDIHEEYLLAGADIIETNSFNATPVSLRDYGLADAAYEISAAAARLARDAADTFSTPEKPRFVAGSMGPTAKSLSLSPDVNDPRKRAITWDELEAAYYENARGLLDGGADLLLIETVFDTLNAKAAIFAAMKLARERGIDVPIIVSATVSDSGGRLLSGQTVEAFCVSVLHADPLALGLNCSFGAEKLRHSIAYMSIAAPCLVCAYPNAGLPNHLGVYEEGPDSMASHIEEYARDGLVNIVGGCCGTTPAHIAAIAAKAVNYAPRSLPASRKKTLLAGLEVLEISRERGLTNVGERANVAGSRRFFSAVKAGDYEEAAGIAREMVEAGAALIDVCMDGALPDTKAALAGFLSTVFQYPDLARIPIMINSSSWELIEAGLKCLQGKGLVNSISLKDGEEEFLRRARAGRSYGAALVVVLADEQGQAVSYERKIAVAARSWKLLLDSHIPAEDIVFDPVVLPLAAGSPEHESTTVDFLRACGWIRTNCPGAQICGGISNISRGFRGNRVIREAMHAVFIKHAFEYGLSIAIVNPATLVPYDEIERKLRLAVEDLILNLTAEIHPADAPSIPVSGDSTKLLLSLAEKYASAKNLSSAGGASEADIAWRNLSVEERITYAMVNGIDDFLAEDIEELKELYWRPLEIVRGPLMKGMKEIGDRFGAGRIFLPQVIRAARVTKKAVEILGLDLKKEDSGAGQKSARILMATVKGDVHSIGKDITALVLSCNGFEIIDMGIMVPAERILETARAEKADIIGLSGLIAPSLDEIVHVAREMERQGFTIPLIVGGAAASLAHTALRIAPVYSGRVVYIPDAGHAPGVVRALLSKSESPIFLEELQKTYAGAVENHDSIQAQRKILSLEEARKNKVKLSWSILSSGKKTLNLPEIFDLPANPNSADSTDSAESTESEAGGTVITLNGYPVDRVIEHIDWISFVQTWDLAVNTYPSAFSRVSREEAKKALDKLLEDAKVLLNEISDGGILSLRGVVGFFPAYSEGDDIVLPGKDLRFCFPRNQERRTDGRPNPCLADYIVPRELYERTASFAAQIGLFALSAGFGLREAEENCRNRDDDYGALLLTGLANSLAEAFSEEVHLRLRDALGGGIRPVFGYPACPDHRDKEIAFRLLGAEERCGLNLTETAMIIPAASVCGMYMAHPDSHYFGVGRIADDQLNDWAMRKGLSIEEAAKHLGRF